MRVVVLTVGSRGDVDPFVALGAGLRRAGHAVCVATHTAFAATVRGAGLDFAPLPGDPRALRAAVEADLGGTGTDQIRFIGRVRRAVGLLAGDLERDAQAACRDAELILYRDVLAFIGYSLAEAVNARPVAATLVPRTPTRAFAFPRPLPFGGAVNALSARLTQQVFWQLFRGAVNRWRTAELALPPFPLTGPYVEGRRRRVPVLCGFSGAIVPRAPDWPAWHYVTGFWSLDPSLDPPPPPALLAFLAAGPPPVYVGFGSSVAREAVARTALVVEALARSGARGILATGWGGLAASAVGQSDRLCVVESAPHRWLFPRVAAVVHHGGAGTTAAGLRAGRPTVVVPSAFDDQPFWGLRVAALGAGPEPIPQRRLTAARLTEAIWRATTDPDLGRGAAELGARLGAEDGVAAAAAALTRHLETERWHWDR